jgi:hypothetical protein
MKSPVVQFERLRLSLAALAIALALNGIAFAQQQPRGTPQQPREGAVPLVSQDPAKSITVEFANDWVSVTRVHYDAYSRVPVHDHPAGTTIYLYLTPSDSVVIVHTVKSDPYHRPAVQPGAIRIATTVQEHHSVENNAATPSEFMRIWLKTEYFGNLARPNTRMTPSVMAYDHKMVHVARINVQPGTTTRVEAKDHPVFRIALVPGKTEWKIATDGYRFLDKGTFEEFNVTGDAPMQLLTVELKTPAKK